MHAPVRRRYFSSMFRRCVALMRECMQEWAKQAPVSTFARCAPRFKPPLAFHADARRDSTEKRRSYSVLLLSSAPFDVEATHIRPAERKLVVPPHNGSSACNGAISASYAIVSDRRQRLRRMKRPSSLLRIILLAISCLGLTGYGLLWHSLLRRRYLHEPETVVSADGGADGGIGQIVKGEAAVSQKHTLGGGRGEGSNDASGTVRTPCGSGGDGGGKGPAAPQPALAIDGGPAILRAGGFAYDDGGGGVGAGDAFPHNRDYGVLIGCSRVCQSAAAGGDDGGSEQPLLLIALVSSLAENGARRDAARRTWAGVRSHRGHAVRTMFVVGRATDAASQANVSAESAAWGDLLQLDFVESYRNLTLKTVLGLRYALTVCRRAMFVMKTDDDVVVLYRNLADHLLALRVAEAHLLYAGSVRRGSRPVRDPSDKWHVGFAEYAGEVYPPYAGGSGYVLSAAAAALVLGAAAGVPYLSMEDAFVGVCAARAHLHPSHHDAFQGYWLLWTACRARSLFTSHGWQPADVEDAWRLVASGGGDAGGNYVSGERAGGGGDDSACPPLDWLVNYYEYTDDEVRQKYQAAVDAANRQPSGGGGDGDGVANESASALAVAVAVDDGDVVTTDDASLSPIKEGGETVLEQSVGGDAQAERSSTATAEAEASTPPTNDTLTAEATA